jgi:hypothetical protein
MKSFLFSILFIFPFLIFGQWVEVVNYSSNIFILNLETYEEIPLTKSSDTMSFDQWMSNYKLNGMPELGYTVDDISELFSIDRKILSDAYDAACAGCQLKWPYSPQAAIEFPEMQLLYRGYDNVFKVAANWPEGIKEYRIEATDATVKNLTRENQKVHTINPKGKISEVKVIYKDAQGNEQSFGPWIYKVKMFPKPEIVTTSISKSKGGRISVELNNGPINVDYRIIKINLGDNLQITDSDVILTEMLKKIKPGKMMPLMVTVINLTTEDEVVINGSIKITE